MPRPRPKQRGRRRPTPKKTICCRFCRRRLDEIKGRLRAWSDERGLFCRELPPDHPKDGWLCDACHDGMIKAYRETKAHIGAVLRRLAEIVGDANAAPSQPYR